MVGVDGWHGDVLLLGWDDEIAKHEKWAKWHKQLCWRCRMANQTCNMRHYKHYRHYAYHIACLKCATETGTCTFACVTIPTPE